MSENGERIVVTGLVAATALMLLACSPASVTSSPSTPTPVPATESVISSPSATAYVPSTPRPLTVAPYVPGPAWQPFGDPIVFDPSITSATTTRHGIRIRISADAATFSSADGLWITTRLENRGNKVLRWVTDGCAIHVGVSARTDVDWTYGAEQRGTFKVYKDWVLDRHSNYEPYPIHLRTVPDSAVDKGPFGCADMGMGQELEPGASLEARHFVRAVTGRDGEYGVPPSGPILLTGSFGSWYREGEDFDAVDHEWLIVSLAVALKDGRDPALISPGQAVDVALGSPQIQELPSGMVQDPGVQPNVADLRRCKRAMAGRHH